MLRHGDPFFLSAYYEETVQQVKRRLCASLALDWRLVQHWCVCACSRLRSCIMYHVHVACNVKHTTSRHVAMFRTRAPTHTHAYV